VAAALRVRCVFRRDSGSLTFDVPPSEISRWRAVARVLRSTIDPVVCTVFPAYCTLCGSPLPQFSSAPICKACWAEIPVQSDPLCQRCGDSLDVLSGQILVNSDAQTASLCRACRLAPPPFVKAVAWAPYQGRMRDLIHALKYDRLCPVAAKLGVVLARAIMQSATETLAEMLVVPVPLHQSKYADRGFNQARLLASEAIAYLRKNHTSWRLTLAPSALMRLRVTESQAGLTPRQRRLNVRGAFGISNPAAVAGKHVLLVEDILTTGATARALLEAGAESVWVATVARARLTSPVSGLFSGSTGEAENVRSINNAPDLPFQHATMNSLNQPSF
jgi:ComF family protein